MRDRIWNELAQAKHNVEFSALYCDEQRKFIKWFNIVILIFSTGGVMGWKVWDDIPLIACLVISTVSLLRLLQPQLIMSDKQLIILDQIHIFYCNYYNQLEKLWYEYEDKRINDSDATTEFFKIKNSETEIGIKVSDCIRRKPGYLVNKAKKYSDEYFTRVFNLNT